MFQAMNNVTNYFNDQLEYQQHNDELVSQGSLTKYQAQRLDDEWEEREWNKRWVVDFPEKVGIGLAKFHAMTLCMRFYETVVCEKILNVDKITLDRLTMDLFKYSLRQKDQREERKTNNTSYPVDHTDQMDIGESKSNSIGELITTCLWANVIGFAADCTIQQIILGYIYARYWIRKRKSAHEHNGTDQDDDDYEPNDLVVDRDRTSSENTLDSVHGGLMLSLCFKSCRLLVSRSIGLLCASVGGAMGSMIYPGYGILFGSQVGDAVAVTLFD
jgi:hypothetical protein